MGNITNINLYKQHMKSLRVLITSDQIIYVHIIDLYQTNHKILTFSYNIRSNHIFSYDFSYFRILSYLARLPSGCRNLARLPSSGQIQDHVTELAPVTSSHQITTARHRQGSLMRKYNDFIRKCGFPNVSLLGPKFCIC